MSTAYAKYSGFGSGGGGGTTGNLTDTGTDGITITGGTGAVNGAGTQIAQHVADASHNGYLSLTDWSTFNSKQTALTFGSISTTTTGLTVGSGANSTVGPNVTVDVQTASGSQPGLLSAADWTTFNGKQSAGSYITALTGDVTASGPGSAAATIAANAVTNAKAAQMATLTIKGNNTGGTANALDLTVAQVKTMLSLTGTNSGDVTLTAVGATPNANGASLSGQALTLQPANASFPGVLTAADWTTFNSKIGLTTPTTSSLYGGTTANGGMTGTANTAYGISVMPSVTSGGNNTGMGASTLGLLTTGNRNTAVGVNAGGSATSAPENTFVGYNAGSGVNSGGDNVLIGDTAGSGISSGNYNICIGAQSGKVLTTGSSNIYIGTVNSAFSSSTNNECVIGGPYNPITRFNFGYDQNYNTTPGGGTIILSVGGDAAGTNIAGTGRKMQIAGVAGTGTGVGGSVTIATAPAGGSGSSVNALVDQLTVTGAGVVQIANLTTQGVVIAGASGALSSEAQLANSRGGTGLNTSASTGLAKVSSGTWSVTTLVNADVAANAAIAASKIAFTVPTIQKFTSGSGTYTTAAGVTYIRVRMVGAGAGGTGSGTASGGNGGAGGNTTFGSSLLVANGGSSSTFNVTPTAGGTASLGSGPIGTAIQGGSGGGPSTDLVATGNVSGGIGGSSPFGGAGAGAWANNPGVAAIANSGSGGGGGGISATLNGISGTGGAAGGFVDAIIGAPSATYAYAVGAAGTAGTAGTSGFAGGAGGSGYIEVTEFYN